jgi:hypothetical protein
VNKKEPYINHTASSRTEPQRTFMALAIARALHGHPLLGHYFYGALI